jgi:hypothetical protein
VEKAGWGGGDSSVDVVRIDRKSACIFTRRLSWSGGVSETPSEPPFKVGVRYLAYIAMCMDVSQSVQID